MASMKHSCECLERFAYLCFRVLFGVSKPNGFENVLDAFDFPQKLEDFLVILNKIWSEDTVQGFDSVHGILEVEGIPGGVRELNFFRK